MGLRRASTGIKSGLPSKELLTLHAAKLVSLFPGHTPHVHPLDCSLCSLSDERKGRYGGLLVSTSGSSSHHRQLDATPGVPVSPPPTGGDISGVAQDVAIAFGRPFRKLHSGCVTSPQVEMDFKTSRSRTHSCNANFSPAPDHCTPAFYPDLLRTDARNDFKSRDPVLETFVFVGYLLTNMRTHLQHTTIRCSRQVVVAVQ